MLNPYPIRTCLETQAPPELSPKPSRKALPRCCHMPDSRKAKSRPPGRRGAAVSAEASLTEKVFGWKAGFSRWRLHSVNQLLVKLLCRGVGLSASAFRYTATVQRMSYVAVPRSRERNQEELKPEVQSSLTPCLTWGQTRAPRQPEGSGPVPVCEPKNAVSESCAQFPLPQRPIHCNLARLNR